MAIVEMSKYFIIAYTNLWYLFHSSLHTWHTVQIFLLLLLSIVPQASLSQRTPLEGEHQNPVYKILLQTDTAEDM